MPRVDSHTPGSFCWFELMTTDQAAAKQFYTQLFGWEVQEFPMGPNETYTIFTRGGEHAAATYTMQADQRQQGIPPNWVCYVSVANVDQSAEKAKSLGGDIVAPPFDVMDMGRMAVVTDPAGTHFAMWQPKTHKGTGVKGEPGTVNWVEISVPDRSKIMSFYQDLFGWTFVTGKDMKPAGPNDEYPHIAHGDGMQGGLPGPEQRDPNVPAHMLAYFSVEDVAASTAKAKSLGANVIIDSMDIGENGKISVLMDPQGAAFALHQGV